MISIAAVVRLASVDVACTVAVTSLPHGGTPLVTGWADPWGKAVCSDEFWFSGALCVSHFFLLLLLTAMSVKVFLCCHQCNLI